jgi:hypothetical protein
MMGKGEIVKQLEDFAGTRYRGKNFAISRMKVDLEFNSLFEEIVDAYIEKHAPVETLRDLQALRQVVIELSSL